MRLTLRTLLAYLDDTLDPKQTHLLGQKVANSQPAQELIDRIRKVLKRGDESVTSKLDANTIAEYIDSVLPPEKLAEVERICLESDAALAEVAACHQILSVILSEPILVPPMAKRRMYSLIRGREAIHSRKAPRQPTADISDNEFELATEGEDALLLSLPVLWRKGNLAQRILFFAGIVLLMVALGFAIWFALPPQEPLVAVSPSPAPDTEVKGKTPVPAKTVEKTKAEPQPEQKTASKTEAKTEPKDKPKKKVEPLPKPKPKPKPAPKPDARVKLGVYLQGKPDEPSVLLTNANGDWKIVRENEAISSGSRLLSLPGFRSSVRLQSGVRLVLWGVPPEGYYFHFALESEVILHSNDQFDLDLTLKRGRIAVVREKVDAPARIRVRFHKEILDLSLLEPGTEVAIELIGYYAPGIPFSKQPGGEGPAAVAGLFVRKGQAHLTIRYDTYLMSEPPGKNAYIWDNFGPIQAPKFLEENQRPKWTGPTLPPLPKDMKSALADLARQFRDSNSVNEVLQLAIRSPNMITRQLAVASFGAINDISSLIDALGNERFPDVRVAAIFTLRHWIALDSANDLIVYKKLQRFGDATAEVIMSLLHDFSPQQASDPQTYEVLIEYLRHERLHVRELAYFHLRRLAPAGANIKYDPAGDFDERNRGYQAWKQLIPTGKLPPPPPKPK
ncbi:MAG: hypothetical protein KatS3mg105_3093 [Gemmatales bacterium]|nr:MAG: hypothetical protein KatS3mg105_3093 [Gemmatales bacterium]